MRVLGIEPGSSARAAGAVIPEPSLQPPILFFSLGLTSLARDVPTSLAAGSDVTSNVALYVHDGDTAGALLGWQTPTASALCKGTVHLPGVCQSWSHSVPQLQLGGSQGWG